MSLLLKNCHLISPGLDLPNVGIEVRDATIHAIHPAGHPLPRADRIIDVAGRRVLPGFIDLHTHGAGGGDACVGELASLRTMAAAKLKEGVTTFLPTTLTSSPEELTQCLQTVAAYQRDPAFAQAPAVHIEGPFLNPNCLGAQNPAFVRPPDLAEMDRMHQIAPIAIISLAAEMPGGMEFIRGAKQRGFITSLAHTAATYAQFVEAKAAGLTHLTHFCNQMTPLHHREIGIVGAGLQDPDILIELICDRLHLSADMLQLVFRLKPLRQLMIITDSIAASHLPDGDFIVGGLSVSVHDGAARLKNGALAGSTLLLNHGLRNVAELTGLPLKDLVATTSWNQAQSLGWPHLGRIEPGYQADLAVLEDDFTVWQTLIGGRPTEG